MVKIKEQKEQVQKKDVAQEILDEHRDKFLKFLEDMKKAEDCDNFRLTLAPDYIELTTEKVVSNIEKKDDSDNRLYTA